MSEMGRVIQNRQIGSDVWEVIIEAPVQARTAQVGQFCHVKVAGGNAPLLRRPISYAGWDREAGTITLLYRVVGEGTRLMTTWRPGDTVDCLGPLGSTFTKAKRMLLVGGGVGIAPMLCMAQALTRAQQQAAAEGDGVINQDRQTMIDSDTSEMNGDPGEVTADVILGFRHAGESFWADLFNGLPVGMHIATDDGSLGTKGYPTTVMEQLLTEKTYDLIITCGPTPMMKGVAKVAAAHGIPCEVSLEERMGCGTGGCLGCGCDGRNGKRYKVCTDGPVFRAEEVGYDV